MPSANANGFRSVGNVSSGCEVATILEECTSTTHDDEIVHSSYGGPYHECIRLPSCLVFVANHSRNPHSNTYDFQFLSCIRTQASHFCASVFPSSPVECVHVHDGIGIGVFLHRSMVAILVASTMSSCCCSSFPSIDVLHICTLSCPSSTSTRRTCEPVRCTCAETSHGKVTQGVGDLSKETRRIHVSRRRRREEQRGVEWDHRKQCWAQQCIQECCMH